MTSQAARVSVPAGPAPPCALMPNRLLPMRASRLRPQSDSRMAWATVTLAGTPVVRCDLCAAVPTAVMKSLSEANAYVWGARLALVEVVGAAAGAGIAGSGTGGVIGPISARATQAMP